MPSVRVRCCLARVRVRARGLGLKLEGGFELHGVAPERLLYNLDHTINLLHAHLVGLRVALGLGLGLGVGVRVRGWG